MTNLKQDIDELKTMEQASPKLRKNKSKHAADAQESSAAATHAPGAVPPTVAAAASATDATAEQENIIEGLTEQLQSLVQDLEEAAVERPALALLAAFGIGVIVGQLLSRK